MNVTRHDQYVHDVRCTVSILHSHLSTIVIEHTTSKIPHITEEMNCQNNMNNKNPPL